MRAGDQVDDACLMYISKNAEESPLTASLNCEPYTESMQFCHAPQVFHQNFLTKKTTQKMVTPASKASTMMQSSASSL